MKLALFYSNFYSKVKVAVALVAVAGVGLAGCLFDQNGNLDPSTAAVITTGYNDVCTALPVLGPISATMNANAQSAYAKAQAMCAIGAPTNALAAGFDILTIEQALLPYLSGGLKATPAQAKAIHRLKAKHHVAAYLAPDVWTARAA